MNTFHKQKYFSHIRIPSTCNEEAKGPRVKEKRALFTGTFKITVKRIQSY